jgi:vitamin B12 transporter
MKKKIFIAAAVIISSHLCTPTYGQAQPDSTKNLDEVVVTANKYPNKAILTGKVLNVITKEQLERAGGKDLAQILNEEAGIYIGGANSNPGKDKSIYLRGAGVDRTLITIDGMPVYDPSGIGGNFDIRNISVAVIERIEILKGSQSTLYGSDAVAGVINIITKKGSNKPFNTTGFISAGSYNTFKGNVGVSGKKDKIDYNIDYSYSKTKGINEAITASNTFDRDGYAQKSMQAGIGIQAAANFRIAPYVRLTTIKGDIDQGAFTDELDYTYNQKSVQAGVRNEISFGKTTLNVLYGYNNINREYIDDSIKSRNGFDTYSKGKYTGAEHFADAYAAMDVTNKVKLTAGVDYRSSLSDQDYSSIGSFGPFTTKYSRDSLKQRQTGLYAAINIKASKNFTVELGNRLNIHSAYGSHYVFNINPSYLIREQVKFFVNISSAYRTPSLYQLFSEYGNKDLKPEAALNTEGGIQYFTADKKFNTRAVIFRRDIKDVIFFYFNSTTFQSQYINRDKQKDNGFELEASYTGIKNITLKAFYNYVDGNISEKTSSGKDTTYFNLLRRPKNNLGLTVSSQITKRLSVSSNLFFIGKREDKYFDAAAFSTVAVTLKKYALLNFYTDYSFLKNKIKIFADLRNIGNSKYVEISGFNTLGFNMYGGLRFSL